MTLNRMAGIWLKTALVWFLLTMLFGLYLGITGQFGASTAHAHLGVLGWLSSAVFALIHAAADPDGVLTPRGYYHWATHNIGLIIQASAMWTVLQTGNGAWGIVIGLGGLVLTGSTIWLVTMVWAGLGRTA
jgi:hypothetical protein